METPSLLIALLPALTAIGVLLVLGIVVRLARERYLRKSTLNHVEVRALQIELTEAARRASLRPGMEVDLAPFWRRSGVTEPDRRAVIQPLIDEHVFGWYERRSSVAADHFLDWIGRIVWNPTRTKVFVSQWVTDKKEFTNVIVGTVLGTLVMGDVDNSTTHGHRAGGDLIAGDRVGRDKVGGNITDVRAGGSVAASANSGSTDIRGTSISSEGELSDALQRLAHEASLGGEDESIVEALHWAAAMATSRQPPQAREQSDHQRILDRAGPLVRAGLSAIVEGATGALAGTWLVELLKG